MSPKFMVGWIAVIVVATAGIIIAKRSPTCFNDTMRQRLNDLHLCYHEVTCAMLVDTLAEMNHLQQERARLPVCGNPPEPPVTVTPSDPPPTNGTGGLYR